MGEKVVIAKKIKNSNKIIKNFERDEKTKKVFLPATEFEPAIPVRNTAWSVDTFLEIFHEFIGILRFFFTPFNLFPHFSSIFRFFKKEKKMN